jgi:uroporphyrinogen III methyltransferase/synthase
MLTGDRRALAGRRIVITRATEQASELTAQLEAAGAQVVALPTVQFLEPDDTSPLDAAIAGLGRYDWIVFTSANAVRFFAKRCRVQSRWPLPAEVRCAVVGSATELALRAEGAQADVMPREASGVALASELGALWNREGGGRRVLVPRSDRASDETLAALAAAGATVNAVVAYRTVAPDVTDADAMQLVEHGHADALVFFSPSAFANLLALTGVEALRNVVRRAAFAAIGPTTAAAIRDAGFAVAVEASEASPGSLVAALIAHFATRAAVG